MGGALTFNLTRAKYKLTESIPLVRGTVNYKAYDFKIMAIHKSDNGTNYTEIEEMPSSGYTINESKSYCENINKVKNTNAVLKTVNGNHVISKLNRNDRCYLYFDKRDPENIPELIAASTKGNGTPNFSKTSCKSGCEETTVGTYTVSDGMYGGTSTADSIAKASVAYNSSYNQSNYVGWTYTGTSQRTLGGTASNAKTQLESWYNDNLASYASKIADGKYCNDRNAQSGSTWAINGSPFNYAAYKRVVTDYQPILSCNSSDVYMLKV